MTDNDPTAILAERDATADRMQRDLDIYRAQTEGMRMAFAAVAQARGMVTISSIAAKTANGTIQAPAQKSGGRPAGAISNPWRNVLHQLHQAYNRPSRGFSPEGFLNCAQGTAGVGNLRLSDAKNRIAEYIKHGYIEATETDGLYRVTDYAMERFLSWGWKPGQFGDDKLEAPATVAEEAP